MWVLLYNDKIVCKDDNRNGVEIVKLNKKICRDHYKWERIENLVKLLNKDDGGLIVAA